MRLFFVFFLFFHGFFHALGFARVFDLGEWAAQPITFELGLFWLAAAILYLATGYSFAVNHRRWWMVGFTAVVVSQALVIVEWEYAAWGTLPNAIVFIVCLISFAGWQFEIKANREADDLRIMAMNRKTGISKNNYQNLPEVVKKWMDRSGVMEAEIPNSVYLTQVGEMRLKEKGNWIPFYARQWFSLSEPGFVWLARVGRRKIIQFAGRDKYQMGKGNMMIRAYSFIPVVNDAGPQVDQGSAVRYLSEIIWFPHMALSGQITWEDLGDNKAKATMHHVEDVEGIFEFGEDGFPVSFEAPRFYGSSGKREMWHIDIGKNILESDGVRIPAQGRVVWKMRTGDFHWLSLEIESVEYLTHHDYKGGEGQFEPVVKAS